MDFFLLDEMIFFSSQSCLSVKVLAIFLHARREVLNRQPAWIHLRTRMLELQGSTELVPCEYVPRHRSGSRDRGSRIRHIHPGWLWVHSLQKTKKSRDNARIFCKRNWQFSTLATTCLTDKSFEHSLPLPLGNQNCINAPSGIM